MILRRPVSLELVVIREGLEPGDLPHGQASALRRVVMDEVVTVLTDVRCDRGRDLVGKLDPEAVIEHLPRAGEFHILMRSEEHTSELQSLMRISYAVFCLKKKKNLINS